MNALLEEACHADKLHLVGRNTISAHPLTNGSIEDRAHLLGLFQQAVQCEIPVLSPWSHLAKHALHVSRVRLEERQAQSSPGVGSSQPALQLQDFGL